MPPSTEERLYLSRVAQGLQAADLLIRDGNIVNVYSGEILAANIAVARGRIAYVRPGEQPCGPSGEVMSAKGYFLSPGYIEPHGHPWVIYNPASLVEAVLPLGTTTLIMDDLVFYQHAGPSAVIKMIEALQDCGPRLYWSARAVPQSPLYNEKELFSPENVAKLLNLPEVITIAEITRWGELLEAQPPLIQVLELAAGQQKRMDGHTAGCKNDGLNALAALGIASCHEPINSNEALERLRLGMWVMLRQSSLRPDLEVILSGLIDLGISLDRVMMTTDAAEPVFISKNGFIEGLLKIALAKNVNPVTAIKIATLNPAVFYGLDQDVGGLAPGRYADILFLKDLQDPVPEKVMIGGQTVARDRKGLKKIENIDWMQLGFGSNFIKPPWLDKPGVFAPGKGRVPVIKLVSSGITKPDFLEWGRNSLPEGLHFCSLMGRKGEFLISCFLSGFAGNIQGLACSFTTSMGVLVIGESLEAMRQAASRLYDMGGGIVLREAGSNIYELPLDIAGMMSSLPLHEAANRLETLYKLMNQRGFSHNDLLLSLLFLSCDFLPFIRITPFGVIDVKNHTIISPAKLFPER